MTPASRSVYPHPRPQLHSRPHTRTISSMSPFFSLASFSTALTGSRVPLNRSMQSSSNLARVIFSEKSMPSVARPKQDGADVRCGSVWSDRNKMERMRVWRAHKIAWTFYSTKEGETPLPRDSTMKHGGEWGTKKKQKTEGVVTVTLAGPGKQGCPPPPGPRVGTTVDASAALMGRSRMRNDAV